MSMSAIWYLFFHFTTYCTRASREWNKRNDKNKYHIARIDLRWWVYRVFSVYSNNSKNVLMGFLNASSAIIIMSAISIYNSTAVKKITINFQEWAMILLISRVRSTSEINKIIAHELILNQQLNYCVIPK